MEVRFCAAFAVTGSLSTYLRTRSIVLKNSNLHGQQIFSRCEYTRAFRPLAAYEYAYRSYVALSAPACRLPVKKRILVAYNHQCRRLRGQRASVPCLSCRAIVVVQCSMLHARPMQLALALEFSRSARDVLTTPFRRRDATGHRSRCREALRRSTDNEYRHLGVNQNLAGLAAE